ncbi:hypothetical protein [Embleya sp. NPDC001921]
MDDFQDVTVEPEPWSRWLSCVVFKAKSPPGAPARVVHSGVLFDTIAAPRQQTEPAIELLVRDGNLLGPVVADNAHAWALVPPGVESSWRELLRISDAEDEPVTCLRVGSLVWLPAQEPKAADPVVWLVPPTLDTAGLPIFTDPVELLDALRQCGRPA